MSGAADFGQDNSIEEEEGAVYENYTPGNEVETVQP